MVVCKEHGESCSWIPLCNDEAGEHTIKYFDVFEDTQSLAAPAFILPPVQEGQKPLCRWGIIHAKILHLKNNWQTSDVAGEPRAITKITDSQFSLTDVAICSDRIMAPRPNQPKHKYGIWNFNNVLGEPVQNIDGRLTAFNITHCHMNDEYMFFIQDLLLQVYRRDGDSYAYAFMGMYSKQSSLCGPGSIFKEPNELFEHYYLQLNGYKYEDRGPKAQVCLVRDRFIALLAAEQSGSTLDQTKIKWSADIHVWGLRSENKLHMLPITSNKNNEIGLLSSNTNDNLIIYYVKDHNGSKVFALDLTTFTKTEIMTILKILPDCVFEGDLFASREHMSEVCDRIKVFNVNASEPDDDKINKGYVFRKRIVQGSVKIRGSNIGLCTDGQLLVKKVKALGTQVFEYRYQKPGMTQDRGVNYQFGEFNTILLVDTNKLPKKIQVFDLTGGTLIKEIQGNINIFPSIRSQHLFILQEDQDEEHGASKLIKCIHFW